MNVHPKPYDWSRVVIQSYYYSSAAWVITIDPAILESSIEAYFTSRPHLEKLQSCLEDENNRLGQLPSDIAMLLKDELSRNTTLQRQKEMWTCVAG